MPVTERQEHELTQKALDKLTEWGKNPNSYGGENIAFALVRQGPLAMPSWARVTARRSRLKASGAY